MLGLTFIDLNLTPPPTDFSHPPTAFLLPIPGRDIYFPPLQIWIIIPPTGHEHKYHPAHATQWRRGPTSLRDARYKMKLWVYFKVSVLCFWNAVN